MGKKVNLKSMLISTGVFIVTILILSFVINSKNREIEIRDMEILRLKESKNLLSFEIEKLDIRRIRRDSLAKTQNKIYEEQIKLLDSANDSAVKRLVIGLIAE